jgi:hypothetical protein
MIPTWMRYSPSPLGMAANLGTLAASLPDSPESLAMRKTRGDTMRQALRDRMSAMPAPGQELGAGMAPWPDSLGKGFDYLERKMNPQYGKVIGQANAAPATPAAAPSPAAAQPSPLDTMDWPFGPANKPGAPLAVVNDPALMAAMHAPSTTPAPPAYSANQPSPMDSMNWPFGPNQQPQAASLPAQRPAGIPSGPSSAPSPQGNPFFPNMVAPQPGQMSRAVSDGEGGMMNDYFTKRLFGFL